jgi:hypothetical protein
MNQEKFTNIQAAFKMSNYETLLKPKVSSFSDLSSFNFDQIFFITYDPDLLYPSIFLGLPQ